MMQRVVYALVLLGGMAGFSGCLKNGTVRTINPHMTANMGTFTFSATYIEPATVKPQLNDSATKLIIRGIDRTTGDEVDLSIVKYVAKPGSFSIVQGEATAVYYHNGIAYPSSGGVVAIKDVGANTISGYFSFTTAINSVTNGDYEVGKPWEY